MYWLNIQETTIKQTKQSLKKDVNVRKVGFLREWARLTCRWRWVCLMVSGTLLFYLGNSNMPCRYSLKSESTLYHIWSINPWTFFIAEMMMWSHDTVICFRLYGCFLNRNIGHGNSEDASTQNMFPHKKGKIIQELSLLLFVIYWISTEQPHLFPKIWLFKRALHTKEPPHGAACWVIKVLFFFFIFSQNIYCE